MTKQEIFKIKRPNTGTILEFGRPRRWAGVIGGASSLLSLSACLTQEWVYDVNLTFPQKPVCSIPSGPVAFDTRPVKEMNFIVKVQDKNGNPVKNQSVIYSFVSNEILPGGKEVTIFSKMLTTNSNGYLTFTDIPNPVVMVTGFGSSSSASTSQSTYGSSGRSIGFHLGGVGVSLGGSTGSSQSSSKSQTYSAFNLTSQTLDGVVPMPNVNYHGRVHFYSDTGENGLSEAKILTSHDPKFQQADPGIRPFEFDVSSEGSSGSVTFLKYSRPEVIGDRDPLSHANQKPVYAATKEALDDIAQAISICEKLAPQMTPDQWFPPYKASSELASAPNEPKYTTALKTNVNWAGAPTCESYVNSWMNDATCADNWIRTQVEIFEME